MMLGEIWEYVGKCWIMLDMVVKKHGEILVKIWRKSGEILAGSRNVVSLAEECPDDITEDMERSFENWWRFTHRRANVA